MKTLNEIADAVYKNAQDKGFHSFEETEAQFIERSCNNLHDEISELHESYRNNKLNTHCDKAGLDLTYLEEELADIIIRALDSSRRLRVNIQRAIELKHQYNITRPFRHGGKKS